MSLSRILNDQPPPRTTQQELSPLARAAAEATLAPVSPIALVVASASPTDVSLDQNGQSAHDMDDQSVSTSTQGRTPALDAIREQVGIDDSASATPEPAPAPAPTTTRGKNGTAPTENGSTTSRRKRKAAAQSTTAATTEPPGERRYGLRRRPQKAKQYAETSPTPDGTPEPTPVEPQRTEEELRLASSDLDDSEDIWRPELDAYAMDFHRRQRYVERWFEQNCMERSNAIAGDLARYYHQRVLAIPLPPPPPPPPVFIPRRSYEEERHQSRHTEYHDVDTGDTHMHTNGWDPRQEDASQPHAGRARDTIKRTVSGISEATSEQDASLSQGPPLTKRRRVDPEDPEDAEITYVGKGKGKAIAPVDDTESVSSVKVKKKSKRKEEAAGVSLPPDEASSRASSPAPSTASAVYEMGDIIPPLKRARKQDDMALAKRLRNLEEAQRKIWHTIAKKDVPKVYRYMQQGYVQRIMLHERTAQVAASASRKPYQRTTKSAKEVQGKGKRLMREMLVTWKKNEREERDVRKREQREAVDRARVEEEKREAARQARKLEFLISQTELYSHFVGNKLKTAEIEGEAPVAEAPAGAEFEDDQQVKPLRDIDFDDEDQTNLYRHASRNAQDALAAAKAKAAQFDKQSALDRKTNEALKFAKGQAHLRDDNPTPTSNGAAPLLDLDSDELNFQNPTSLQGELTVQQPKLLNAQLKEYQLKGLNWLATLYEQGINGILADEMGLGKTIQSIALIAHLAETQDIWGPFLVVSPASTLHNWQQELTRFVPKLKALPYWGNVKDRATLRKLWGKKEISYDKDAPFHVLITSYQLVTQDQQYFQRVKWQYMILDEAQNIKNSSSQRWKTLLGFNCRNRLLLTGTPIQNSMQELWALLHFIMPSLFDSHDEFNEWFSKDIENAAEKKGQSHMSEYQLRRLHMILKPFMLRRVKRHVQNELSEKIEEDIYVDLSYRQRALYRQVRSNVSIADLLQRASSDAESARSLMNLVMQFRKVCNHPELMERADVEAPLSFCSFGASGPLNREGDIIHVPYSTKSPIDYMVPELLYLEGGLIDVPREASLMKSGAGVLSSMMNIWSTDVIQRSLESSTSAWSFLRFLNKTPAQAHALHTAPFLSARLSALEDEAHLEYRQSLLTDTPSNIWTSIFGPRWSQSESLTQLRSVCSAEFTRSCLSRPEIKIYKPAAVAPPITMHCHNRSFLENQEGIFDAPKENLALYGLSLHRRDDENDFAVHQRLLPGVPPTGLFAASPSNQMAASTMQVPEAKSLIYDSAKLARLDVLLQELKTGDHRVLIYSQMTRMLDLMEEYLIYRQYKYLRLDGSSKLEDRRDMVIEWQTRPDIFVFLLSTRAGGLGINLTAADTVVFYDHDWNPSNDAQAMDRAHRLGQTRQVTVYRLITRGTIDERIVQLARVKKDVQDIVVGNKTLSDVNKPNDIVQLLLTDDQIGEDGGAYPSDKSLGKRPVASDGPADGWAQEDGDDFFGHSGPPAAAAGGDSVVEDTGEVVPVSGRGRGRGRGRGAGRGTGRGRGRGKAAGEPTSRGRGKRRGGAAAADT